MCLNTGAPKNINFSFVTNGKLMALGVPILKHFRVNCSESISVNVRVKHDAKVTLKAPNKNCSRRHFIFFYFYFSKKIRLEVSCESSAPLPSRGFT